MICHRDCVFLRCQDFVNINKILITATRVIAYREWERRNGIMNSLFEDFFQLVYRARCLRLQWRTNFVIDPLNVWAYTGEGIWNS